MLWFVFFKSDMLIRKCHDGTYTVPRCDDPPIAVKHSTEIHQITPMEDGEEVRTFRVDAPITYLDDHEMCGLRSSFYKLPKEIYLKAGHCHQLLFWDYTTQFCGICGGRMKKESYISKRCTVCGNEIWPSPAIAVITLIRNGDKALLVHANNFRKNFYGLVAGFVELGETLENAARREICEEVGLTVGELKYISSQPWPYPNGLMVGFMTDYVSGRITLQQSELSDGQWFTKDNLPTLPEKLSIARQLIDMWLKEQ